ncbi:hypothetical protein QOZ80_4BG0355750 [Eleusine coracana subsp. coracana]|nr:hypothetical protein QOZ80_4BG0355750 [Eleusine coracana subsp. coracana]
MSRKRRDRSATPPRRRPPPQQSSSSEDSGSNAEEEDSPRAATAQMPPQNPQSHLLAAAANNAEEESGLDTDAQAFQMRSVRRSRAKPVAPAPHLESNADEEEDGGSESDPEVQEPDPVPVPKKGKATKKSKTVALDKKRPAEEPARSSKSKKAKAEAGKVAPEATASEKGKKKVNAKMEKATPVPTPSREKLGRKAKKSEHPPSSSGKSLAHRPWSKGDSIMILEALAAHGKSNATAMKTEDLLKVVRDHLERNDCSHGDMYDKVRSLKKRYYRIVSTGNLPSEEDDLRMYNLSEEVWGEKAMAAMAAAAAAAAAAASQKDSCLTKSSNEKVDGNSKRETVKEVANENTDTQKGCEEDQAVEVETGRNVKSKQSKEGNAPAIQNDDTLANGKGEKTGKEASTGNQNGGTGTEEDTHEEDAEKEAGVQGTHKSFDELQNLYPNLAGCVERIKAEHSWGETLTMAFGFIDDEQANALESKIKAQRVAEAKTQIEYWDIKQELLSMLIDLMD